MSKRISSKEIINRLIDTSLLSVDEVIREGGSDWQGLSQIEAATRLGEVGANEISYEKRSPWYIYLLRSFLDPFILILLAIVALSFFTDVAFASKAERGWETIVIISFMILISVVLRFTQEYKSQITADNLKDLIPTTTAVKRKGNEGLRNKND